MITLEKKEKSKKMHPILKGNGIYLFSFIIPIIVLFISYATRGVWPFGTNSMMITDGINQYIPFVAELHNKIYNGESIFYTWHAGLGSDFYSIWAFYLSSPSTFLLALFPLSWLNAIAGIITALKLGLCGISFTYYLTHRLSGKQAQKTDYRILIFSLGYALSSYAISFSYIIMWMDSLILLPIVMLGLDYLIHKKDARLYIVTLALALFCNYYIGFMLCLFLILYFLFYNWKNIHEFMYNGIRFALSSLLAGGLVSIVLIPIYLQIRTTSTAGASAPIWGLFNSFTNELSSFMACSYPYAMTSDSGSVNLFCGSISIVLLILFFTNKRETLSSRIKRLVLLAILFFSFNITVLNYVWHGFHEQYMVPNRFSFLFIFLLLISAFEAIDSLEHIGYVKLTLSCMLPIAVYLVCLLTCSYYSITPFLVTIDLFIFYCILFVLYRRNSIKSRTLWLILILCTTVELGGSAIYQGTILSSCQFDRYYKNDTVNNSLIENHQIGATLDRMVIDNPAFSNSDLWYHINGIDIFSSTLDHNKMKATRSFGLRPTQNGLLYYGLNPVTESLFAVNYVIGDTNSFDANHHFEEYTLEDKIGTQGLYTNPNPLSIGFSVSNDLMSMDQSVHHPYENLNHFIEAAVNTQGPFSLLDTSVNEFETSNCEFTDKNGTYQYLTTDLTFPSSIQYSHKVTEAGDYYFYTYGNHLSSIQVLVDNKEVFNGNTFSYHVGDLQIGQTLTIRYTTRSAYDTGMIDLELARYDAKQYQIAYTMLKKEPLVVTSYSANQLKGSITVAQDSTLFTSIPGSKGWHAYVDNKPVEYSQLFDSFICIPLTAGTHTIRMTYIPDGFAFGLVLSMLSLCILIIAQCYRKRKGQSLFQLLTIFEKNNPFFKKLEHYISASSPYFIAFLVPASVFLILCLLNTIAPFGDHTIFCKDALHQFLPFLSSYYDKLKSGESLFYSWNSALGSDYYALWCCYLASPFNLLLLLFPKSQLYNIATITCIFRICLCAPTMFYYLTHRPSISHRKPSIKNDPKILIFTSAYSLSAYLLSMYNNIMYLDAVLLLPLLILGLERLIKERNCKLYIVSLTYCLFTNYYISYMLCIFLVLYFLFWDWKNIKECFQSGIRFAVSSIFAAGCSAIVLIPAYIGLQKTVYVGSGKDSWPKFKLLTSFLQNLNFHTMFSPSISITNKDGYANVYCGILIVMLFFLYLFNRKIKLQQRIKAFLLVTFLYASFNISTLNYIWHGFHKQVKVPNRFSFLYIFLLLVLAYDAIQNIQFLKRRTILIACILCCSLFGVTFLFAPEPNKPLAYIITFAVLMLYGIILFLYRSKKMKHRSFAILLSVLCIVEIVTSSFQQLSYLSIAPIDTNYFVHTENMLTQLKADTSDSFYRMDQFATEFSNEGYMYDYKAISIFNTTYSQRQRNAMSLLGLSASTNVGFYSPSIPPFQTIIGIKYLFINGTIENPSCADYYKTYDSINAYTYPYYSSIGFSMDNQIQNWTYFNENPFVAQNAYASIVLGNNKKLYDIYTYSSEDIEMHFIKDSKENTQTSNALSEFEADSILSEDASSLDASSFRIDFTGNVPKSGMGYFYYAEAGTISSSETPYQENDTFKFTYTMADDSVSTPKGPFYYAVLNDSVFKEFYHKLCTNAFTVTNYDDNHLAGTATAYDNHSSLFLSIPYDEGWHATVNGRKVTPIEVANSFMVIPLEKGENCIQLHFVSQGFILGGSISLITILILFLLSIIKCKHSVSA